MAKGSRHGNGLYRIWGVPHSLEEEQVPPDVEIFLHLAEQIWRP